MHKFDFEGETYEVPAFAEMPIGVMRKARKADNDMDRAFIILEEALGVDSPALAVIDRMKPAEFSTWLQGWTQGASLGESSGSVN